MKRIHTLIVLLGLVLGAMLTGCSQSDTPKPDAGGTNATPAAPSTNK